MRRHVNDVTRPRHQVRQTLGAGKRAFRRLGGFDRMYIEVARAGMVRCAAQHALQRGDQLQRAWLRTTVTRPLVPGAQVQHRVGEDHLDVLIGRVLRGHTPHGVRERAVSCRARGAGRLRITNSHRVNQGALPRRGVAFHPDRGTSGGERPRFHRWIHRQVDVGAERVGHAPVTERTGGIELDRALERSCGFIMVERVHQSQSLVEIAL